MKLTFQPELLIILVAFDPLQYYYKIFVTSNWYTKGYISARVSPFCKLRKFCQSYGKLYNIVLFEKSDYTRAIYSLEA